MVVWRIFSWNTFLLFYFKEAYGWSERSFLKDESGVNKTRLISCTSITSDLNNEKTRANLPHVPASTGFPCR